MSSNRDPPSYPAVPRSLHTGNDSFEMNTYERKATANRPAYTIPEIAPYLGLRARLSQIWLNKWTILILLIICRLLLATKDINSQINSAKTEALSACTSVENVGSAMASMPHYLSGGVNAMAADGITHAVNGLMDMITLAITVMEEVILFYINMLTSTYVCLITFAVAGSLHAAIDIIEGVADFMNSSISSVTGEIASDISTFTNGLNKFLDAIDLFNIGDAPKIDLTSQLNSLTHITIDPTKLDAGLSTLNSSIPDFAEVQNFTNAAIRFPFETIKQFINSSLPAYKFDGSIFPVAEKQALTFCSDNQAINNFFGGLLATVIKTRTIVIVLLALAAVAVCIPMAYRERRRFIQQKDRASLFQASYDPMDVIYLASRPMTGSAGVRMASWFQQDKTRILVRWWVAYSTTIPALFVLALGVAGLLSCLCQFIVLKMIEKEVPALANEVGDFAGVVVTALNNASTAWAVGANQVIGTANVNVNNDVFGWVNTSTTAINNTLTVFSDEMVSALNFTFGGTILYDPIMEVMNCLIGLKIAGIQKGLTWVHDNAHVTFPEFNPNVFSLGAAASIASNSSSTDSFLSSPGDVASDGITSSIVKLTDKLTEQVYTEAVISACLVALWAFVVLMGLVRILFAMFRREKTRGEGGNAYTGQNRVSITPRSPNRGVAANSGFPNFGSQVVESRHEASDPWMGGGAGSGDLGDEKLRSVRRKEVGGSYSGGHERSSSYGQHGFVADEKR